MMVNRAFTVSCVASWGPINCGFEPYIQMIGFKSILRLCFVYLHLTVKPQLDYRLCHFVLRRLIYWLIEPLHKGYI